MPTQLPYKHDVTLSTIASTRCPILYAGVDILLLLPRIINLNLNCKESETNQEIQIPSICSKQQIGEHVSPQVPNWEADLRGACHQGATQLDTTSCNVRSRISDSASTVPTMAARRDTLPVVSPTFQPWRQDGTHCRWCRPRSNHGGKTGHSAGGVAIRSPTISRPSTIEIDNSEFGDVCLAEVTVDSTAWFVYNIPARDVISICSCFNR
jgi:hypothetical protein